MSETPDIEILPHEEDDGVEVKPQRLVGYKTLGLATIFAALLGAGGGAFIAKVTDKPAPNLAPLRTKLDTLASENKTLKAQISQVQKGVKAIPKSNTVDVAGIEARLGKLESAEPQPIDPDLVARLEALKGEGSDVLDLSDIKRRLDSLETIGTSDETRELIQDLYERVAEWEIKLEDVQRKPEPAKILPSETTEAIDFPKAAILAALDSEKPAGGWLKRTLNKHISVQSEDNPRYVVELIETDIANGDMASAVMKFDKLPEAARTAGQDWRKALRE